MRRFMRMFVSVLVLGMVLLIRTVERGNAQSQAPQAPRTLTVLVS